MKQKFDWEGLRPEIARAAQAGMSLRDLAKLFSISVRGMVQVLARLGIQTQGQKDAVQMEKDRHKAIVDEVLGIAKPKQEKPLSVAQIKKHARDLAQRSQTPKTHWVERKRKSS